MKTEAGQVAGRADRPAVVGAADHARGVFDQRGNLVGIPIGRMQGDYRFSFILPIRAEMLRKLPNYEQPEPIVAIATADQQ